MMEISLSLTPLISSLKCAKISRKMLTNFFFLAYQNVSTILALFPFMIIHVSLYNSYFLHFFLLNVLNLFFFPFFVSLQKEPEMYLGI